MNRIEFKVEEYNKLADNSWHLRETRTVPERGYTEFLKNGQFYFYGKPINLNTDPNSTTCGAYFKVVDIVRQKDYAITDKIICEFTAHYRYGSERFVIGVLVYRNSMPTYFCHPNTKPHPLYGYGVHECHYTEDIMDLRKWLIRKFKGNIYFDDKNRKNFALII